MPLTITSHSFENGGAIPRRYTCDGEDMSPPLSWSGMPERTKSFAIVVDDPDAPAGTWVHWVAYNIPPTATGFMEGRLPDGTEVGLNSWGRTGYGGPCPPGGTHRYIFHLHALDARLDLPHGAGADDLLAAMEGHVLASAELMGNYSRQ